MTPSREELIDVFTDTMNQAKRDADFLTNIKEVRKNTLIYENGKEIPLRICPWATGEVNVTGRRTLEAAAKAKGLFPKMRVGLLNFANAYHPGGGVKSGAVAQEESICRSSLLYPALIRPYVVENYYKSTDKDKIIYTPDVLVIKDDEDLPQNLEKRQQYKVDIFTTAAPDLGEETISRERLYEIHLSRARRIFQIAISKGVHVLILGAFGCGAFLNPPEVVASAYKAVIHEYRDYFQLIEFAMGCGKIDSDNSLTFKQVLGPVIGPGKRVNAGRNRYLAYEMPKSHEIILFKRMITRQEFHLLKKGVSIKKEDPWFAYMEGPVLCIHRSSTGFCMFQLMICPNSERQILIVNQDGSQYQGSISQAQATVTELLNWWTRSIEEK